MRTKDLDKQLKESYPQVDIEVQGEIYTIPVNYEDRENIFGNAEYELEDLLDSLNMMTDGWSASVIASDLRQSELVDMYGNEDVKTFNRIKSLGVQVDSLNGILD